MSLFAMANAGPAAAEFDPVAWVDTALKTTRAPGVAAGHSDGQTVAIATGGLRAARQPAPVADDDLWHIGSITKSMTATLVARLVEDGQVQWTDTVGTVLGEVIAVDPALADVTYAELLTHRSGLQANLGLAQSQSLSGMLDDRDMIADRLTYASAVLTEPPKQERGTFLYSNAGYVVVGAMLQQTTGTDWETLMRRHVFEPLGMASAGFGPPGSAVAIDQPRGHRGWLLRAMAPGPRADNIPALGPAGTVHVAVSDMLVYLQTHARQDRAFLSTESWTRLHTPPAGADYAMGWGVTPQGWRVHDGSNTLWYASAGFVPGTDRATFMAANFVGWGKIGRVMGEGLLLALED